MSPPPIGILFVGHGTRSEIGQKQFLDLAETVAHLLPDSPLRPAFLELAQPSIETALSDLAQVCDRFITLPLLLFTAGHAREDIPNAVESASEKLRLRCLGYTAPLQHHRDILALAQQRFLQALSPLDLCVPAEERALLVLGRGSSDLSATRAMRHLTILRKRESATRYAGTAFFAVAKPNLDMMFEYLYHRRRESLIVVQPHLLFDGLLWQQANSLVKTYQAKSDDRQWRITQPLGHDDSLASALANIAGEFLSNIHD
jgi:sirohydrochlorin cobaltochelatase